MREPADEYFRIYLEDTEEQVAALQQSLAAWAQDPFGDEWFKESLRLLHAMEGAAGALGFDNVRALTHYLNRQFHRALDQDALSDVAGVSRLLQGVEFLRICNQRLRGGESLGDAAELLQQLQEAMERWAE